MRICATTVTYEGFQREADNPIRIEATKEALKEASKLRADVLILPAGFLYSTAAVERESAARSLIDIAKQSGVAILFGVDQARKNVSKAWEREIRGDGLPWYAYAWSPGIGIAGPWKQRSFTSRNQRWVSDETCNELRLVSIRGENVAVLLCGEIFNHRIRLGLANTETAISYAVDLAHYSRGFRVHAGMKVLAGLGITSVCSVHTQRTDAHKYCYLAGGKNLSSRQVDGFVGGPPSIEMKVWSL